MTLTLITLGLMALMFVCTSGIYIELGRDQEYDRSNSPWHEFLIVSWTAMIGISMYVIGWLIRQFVF